MLCEQNQKQRLDLLMQTLLCFLSFNTWEHNIVLSLFKVSGSFSWTIILVAAVCDAVDVSLLFSFTDIHIVNNITETPQHWIKRLILLGCDLNIYSPFYRCSFHREKNLSCLCIKHKKFIFALNHMNLAFRSNNEYKAFIWCCVHLDTLNNTEECFELPIVIDSQ